MPELTIRAFCSRRMDRTDIISEILSFKKCAACLYKARKWKTHLTPTNIDISIRSFL